MKFKSVWILQKGKDHPIQHWMDAREYKNIFAVYEYDEHKDEYTKDEWYQ